MILKKEEAELFYKLNWALLFYVNQKYKIIPNLNSPNFQGQNMEDVDKLSDKWYSHPEIIGSFINENPFNFNQEELKIIKSWKNAVRDDFFILSHLKDYTIFLRSGEKEDKPKTYAVIGLYTEIKDIIPFEPYYVKTMILPFKGKIVYHGALNGYSINFGGGFKGTLKRDYQKAINKFGLILSLEESISEKEESDEGLLKFYLKNEANRVEYADDIEEILKKKPPLLNIYYRELGKANAKKIKKRFSELGIGNGWFAILEDVIIASGNNEEEILNQLNNLISEEKKEHVHLFKYENKHLKDK